jgi:hypothetical protein
MTRYFFDEESESLIAYNEQTKAARVLSILVLEGISAAAPALTEEPFPKRKYTKRDTPPARASQPKPVASGCPECGSPSRHKKECSKAKSNMEGNKDWKNLGGVSAPRAGAMTRMEFGRVQIARSHDLPIETIARNLDLAEVEVSKASDAETYDDYLKL